MHFLFMFVMVPSARFSFQVCFHNGNIRRTFNQFHAPLRLRPYFTAEESSVEKPAALHYWRPRHQSQLLPGILWVWALWVFFFFATLLCSALSMVLLRTAVSWDNLRIPGVLQRLAWSYFVVACLDLLVARAHLDILPTVRHVYIHLRATKV